MCFLNWPRLLKYETIIKCCIAQSEDQGQGPIMHTGTPHASSTVTLDHHYTMAEVQRLSDGGRDLLAAHFLALSTEDRRLRFGASLSAESIIAYVERIDFDNDAVFGLFDDELALAG